MSGRSRARGRRTPRNGAAAVSASDATPSRATDSPTGPSRGTATAMAGNALAQSTPVPAAARLAGREPAGSGPDPPGPAGAGTGAAANSMELVGPMSPGRP